MARKTVTLEQLDNFTVDDKTNELFWRDKPVVTTMSLPWWVHVAALAGGFGAVVSAIATVAALFK